MKKRRRLKKKIRNRLILAFGLLIALFILITLIKGRLNRYIGDMLIYSTLMMSI